MSRYNWAPAMTVSPILALEAPPSLGEGGARLFYQKSIYLSIYHLNSKTVINYHPPLMAARPRGLGRRGSQPSGGPLEPTPAVLTVAVSSRTIIRLGSKYCGFTRVLRNDSTTDATDLQA